MPKITFIEKNGAALKVDAPLGLSVMEIALKNGITIEGACGGCLACSTCHVIVHPDWCKKLNKINENEEDMLDIAFDIQKTSRLSCQILITKELDGLIVAVPGAKTPWNNIK